MVNNDVKHELRQLAADIKLLMLDVDGVLTDGRIIYDSRGRDSKFFDVHDGMGVYALYRAGIKTVLITAKKSRAIIPRARDMHVAEVLVADRCHKSALLESVLKKYGVGVNEVAFMGDDLVDICLMKRVGFPIAVFNACPEIKLAAKYITLKHGGKGAVREVAELILKSQNKWAEIVKYYDV